MSLELHDATVSRPHTAGATATLNIPVKLTKPETVPVTVHVATNDYAPMVAAGVGAVAGRDYDAASSDLTFAPGETVKSFPVTVHGTDSTVQITLYFEVQATHCNVPVSMPRAFGLIQYRT